MKAFKVYPFTLLAGGSQVILADASFVRVLTATGAVALSLDDIGPFGPVNAGQGFNLAANPDPGAKTSFKRLLITDLSGSGNVGNLIVADAAFVDQTLVGNVSVIDGSRATTIAKAAFVATGAANCGVGQFLASALWNKSTTKNLRLKQLSYDVNGAGFSLAHRRITAAFGALDAAAVTKYLDGTQSASAETRALNAGGAIPANDGFPLRFDVNLTNRSIQFIEPFIIPPATGYMIASNIAATAAANLGTAWEFVEDPL